MFHRIWNPIIKEPIPQMAVALMASPLFPGNMVGHLPGTSLVPTLLLLPTSPILVLNQESTSLNYLHLFNTSHFIPVAVETTGAFSPSALAFLHEIGRRIKIQTGDQSSTYYLLQQISIAIRRGNVESILGTISHSSANSPLFI